MTPATAVRFALDDVPDDSLPVRLAHSISKRAAELSAEVARPSTLA